MPRPRSERQSLEEEFAERSIEFRIEDELYRFEPDPKGSAIHVVCAASIQ